MTAAAADPSGGVRRRTPQNTMIKSARSDAQQTNSGSCCRVGGMQPRSFWAGRCC